jgi:geranylgeranyl transferase type-2 subunit alpha
MVVVYVFHMICECLLNTSITIFTSLKDFCSILLSNLLKRKVQGFFPKEKVLNEEYELVHQALFTDPDDQSGWFYHLWLLDQTVKADAPLLISSWPAHDSNLILSGDRCLDDCALSAFDTFRSDSGTIPLVLYFSQAVEGVNSCTVSVESVFNTKGELTWKPLSTNNSQTAQVWVTHLNYPEEKLHSSEAYYPVEVRVGHSQGIISSSGFHYNHPSMFAFKVFVRSVEKDPAEHGGEMISWRDENFLLYETRPQESNPLYYLDQLNIKDCHEQTSSMWRAETLANEIALFRELLSEINW